MRRYPSELRQLNKSILFKLHAWEVGSWYVRRNKTTARERASIKEAETKKSESIMS
jgi:hypothetical protein